MIPRDRHRNALQRALARSPVCALLGPRQCGKTTLARAFAADTQLADYFDLESAADMARMANPGLELRGLDGLVVIDEVQRRPDIFRELRVIVDEPGCRARFLLLGSASPQLVKETSESLAGRIEFVELAGFDLREVGVEHRDRLWIRGCFPRSFLADSDEDSFAWRDNFIRTFLERDLPELGLRIPSVTMRRFWTMLAHYHGQTWNAAELGQSMGVSSKTVNRYLDILCGTFLARRLAPWHANLKKRQVKSPKVYLRDSGIVHSLLGLANKNAVLSHPKLGASWEGFMLELVLNELRVRDAYFWATHTGAELDLLVFLAGRPVGIEFKWSDAPTVTPSMRTALEDLELESLWVVYPGTKRYRLTDRITVLPADEAADIAVRPR